MAIDRRIERVRFLPGRDERLSLQASLAIIVGSSVFLWSLIIGIVVLATVKW